MALDNFCDNGNHALLTGQVCGALMRAGLDAQPVKDEDGDYLPYIYVTQPSGRWKITVEPLD